MKRGIVIALLVGVIQYAGAVNYQDLAYRFNALNTEQAGLIRNMNVEGIDRAQEELFAIQGELQAGVHHQEQHVRMLADVGIDLASLGLLQSQINERRRALEGYAGQQLARKEEEVGGLQRAMAQLDQEHQLALAGLQSKMAEEGEAYAGALAAYKASDQQQQEKLEEAALAITTAEAQL